MYAFLFLYLHSLLLQYSQLDIPATWYRPLPVYIDTPSSCASGPFPMPKSFKYDGLKFTESSFLGTHDKVLITTDGCLMSSKTSLGCYRFNQGGFSKQEPTTLGSDS